jgi:hypothetical protein
MGRSAQAVVDREPFVCHGRELEHDSVEPLIVELMQYRIELSRVAGRIIRN